jgi:hypothetical protein
MITQYANRVVARIGVGDVGIGTGLCESGNSFVLLTNIEPGVVGRDLVEDYPNCSAPIALEFNNIESLTVVIEVLTQLKTTMLSKQ